MPAYSDSPSRASAGLRSPRRLSRRKAGRASRSSAGAAGLFELLGLSWASNSNAVGMSLADCSAAVIVVGLLLAGLRLAAALLLWVLLIGASSIAGLPFGVLRWK